MIDLRMTLSGAALIAAGLPEQEAAEATYLANITADQRRMIEREGASHDPNIEAERHRKCA